MSQGHCPDLLLWFRKRNFFHCLNWMFSQVKWKTFGVYCFSLKTSLNLKMTCPQPVYWVPHWRYTHGASRSTHLCCCCSALQWTGPVWWCWRCWRSRRSAACSLRSASISHPRGTTTSSVGEPLREKPAGRWCCLTERPQPSWVLPREMSSTYTHHGERTQRVTCNPFAGQRKGRPLLLPFCHWAGLIKIKLLVFIVLHKQKVKSDT